MCTTNLRKYVPHLGFVQCLFRKIHDTDIQNFNYIAKIWSRTIRSNFIGMLHEDWPCLIRVSTTSYVYQHRSVRRSRSFAFVAWDWRTVCCRCWLWSKNFELDELRESAAFLLSDLQRNDYVLVQFSQSFVIYKENSQNCYFGRFRVSGRDDR